jgi:hypothetical protein
MVREIIAKFRQKGATSPDKAVTAQDLGLPPRFEEAMHGRLGASGIFVEVDGKYYLDEARLKHLQEQRTAWRGGMGGGAPSRGTMLALRMTRMVVGLVVILLIISNILVARSLYLSLVIIALLFLWVALTVAQLYYLSRLRNRWRESQASGDWPGPAK